MTSVMNNDQIYVFMIFFLLLAIGCSDSAVNNESTLDQGIPTVTQNTTPSLLDSGFTNPQSTVDMEVNIEPNQMLNPGLSVSCQVQDEVCDALDNDCDGQVDEELSCACNEDTSCYGGPPNSRRVGLCRDGVRSCSAGGEVWEICEGWVAPSPEKCEGGEDEDCDGQIDEGNCIDLCMPGAQQACYSGPMGSEGVGICNGGTQVCQADRTWGSCEGEELPQQEICDDGIDNDCDGTLDSDCYDDLPDVVDEREVGVDVEARPVDFIMAIDNSGSMSDTVELLEQNLGFFAERLLTSGIDYRLILISERDRIGDTAVCISEPLAGPDCGNGPNFLHLNERVSSSSAYRDLIECYNECDGNQGFSNFLRDQSLRQVIVVTDDDASITWNDFRDQFFALIGDFILHGVIGTFDDRCVADVGERYIDGIQETQGEALHICDGDWGQVIDVLFDATISRLQTRFSLSRVPVVNTIQVYLRNANGEELIDPSQWRYIETDQVIEFLNLELPANRIIVIRYKARP